MINICLAIHDANGNYSKYAGVSIQSILCHTSERIHFFILHDDSITEIQKKRISSLIRKDSDLIDFYAVEIPENWHNLKFIKIYSIGTLFRLLIPNKLPKEVKKVIYIDADTLTNLDIRELWDIDMERASVCGRKEVHYDNPLFKEGIAEDSYVNAGVLILNLERIREKHNLYEESVDFFKEHPNCMWNDEDAINFVLNGQQKLISSKYNTYTVLQEESEPECLKECIYHFAGDHPRANGERSFDREFYRILRQTPWWEKDEVVLDYFYGQNSLREADCGRIRRIAFSMGTKKHIVFWGAKETQAYKIIRDIYDFSRKEVWAVDVHNDKQIEFDGIRVENPKKLNEFKGEAFVIVLAYNHYSDISRELSNMGYTEEYDYAESRMLLSEPEGGRFLL